MEDKDTIDYLRGIAENDFSVLQRIYRKSLPDVSRYIQRNSGTKDDAKDIFQEGILVIYKKVKKEELVLTTTFHNYLFSVCKRIWLKKLSKKSKKEVPFEGLQAYSEEDDLADDLLKSRKWALFNTMFSQLSEECQQALKMLFNGYSSKEIGEKMGYTEDYAKRKKYKCKRTLASLIQETPEYQYIIKS
jgi:RNA polymerase sigma factor (sigma-70 family)